MEHLQNREKQFQDAYDSLLNLLADLNESTLNTNMEAGKWSPGQTMAHIHLASISSLERAISKVSAPDRLKRQNWSSKFKGLLLLFFLRSNRKFKAPAITAEVPDKVSMQELLLTYETVKVLMTDLRKQWRPELTSMNVFTHPKAGPINLITFYRFLFEHIQHHRRQIEQFLKNR